MGFLLYSLLTWTALAAVPAWLLASLALRPRAWREHVGRLGLLPGDQVRSLAGGIWLQAASVGELQVAALLAAELLRLRPGGRVVVSVTTPAARRAAARGLPDGVQSFPFPLDLPPVAWRSARLLRPALFVAVETEIWPHLFRALRAGGSRLAVVNGRISDTSLPRYRRVRGLMSSTLACADLILARTPEDARRFTEVGAAASRVRVAGDLKFDRPEPSLQDLPAELSRLLSSHTVLVGGSTQPGEEAVLLDVARRAASMSPPLLLVLAPRHRRRLAEVEEHLGHSGLPWVRRTELAGRESAAGAPVRVLLLDSHGELPQVYAGARGALVGGTLAPVGGHTPLEAAAGGVPMVSGPHVANIRSTARRLQEAGALQICTDAGGVARALLRLLQDPAAARIQGAAARRVMAEHRGATGSVAREVLGLLSQAGAP